MKTTLHSFGLAIFEDAVIWSDQIFGEINMASKYTGGERRQIVSDAPHVSQIRVSQDQVQPFASNRPCLELACSHMCLLHPGTVTPQM